MKKLPFNVFLFACLLFNGFSSIAQGDGPRSYLLIPKGGTFLNARWMGLNQNINSTGSILVPGADIDVNVFPVTLYQTFSLAGRFAQVSGMINPGQINASAINVPPVFPLSNSSVEAQGFSDGFLSMRVGLLGSPALSVKEYLNSSMRFSVFGDFRFWYSGSYDASKAVNLGTNRETYQLGLPMAIPLNNNVMKPTWLEFNPSISFFSDNNNPAKGTNASKIEQNPIFSLESHISHNLTNKFWIFANALYKQGGQTVTDGVKNGNKMSLVASGAGFGYQFKPYLGLYCDYGQIVAGGGNDAESKMFRVALNFSYFNLKKNGVK